MITHPTSKRTMSKILGGSALVLAITLGACASNLEIARYHEAYYQEMCGTISEGLNTTYETCRAELIKKQREAVWLAKIDKESELFRRRSNGKR